MLTNKNFDFLGLYPKPISQMTKLELLFSSAITVFFLLGLATAFTMLIANPIVLLKLIGSISFFVSGVYFLLHTLQQRSLRSELAEIKKNRKYRELITVPVENKTNF